MAAPANGATMYTHNELSTPPMRAGPRVRAGLTEAPEKGIPAEGAHGADYLNFSVGRAKNPRSSVVFP